MTLVLAFDTSGPWCAAGLWRDGKVVACQSEPMIKGQAERLFPMLEEVLAAGHVSWRDLDRIGVGTGPGNFTGIRVAVSAARGLALGLEAPAIGIGGLSALLAAGADAALPAPRGQSYRLDYAGAAVLVEAPGPDVDPEVLLTGIARLTAEAAIPAPRPAPVYLRPADAAPPSDPPPVILP